jgi:hypothetical protein
VLSYEHPHELFLGRPATVVDPLARRRDGLLGQLPVVLRHSRQGGFGQLHAAIGVIFLALSVGVSMPNSSLPSPGSTAFVGSSINAYRPSYTFFAFSCLTRRPSRSYGALAGRLTSPLSPTEMGVSLEYRPERV